MRSQMKHIPGLPMPRFGTTGHLLVRTDRPSSLQVLDLVGVEQVVQLVGEMNRQRADRAADIVGVANLEAQHLAVGLDRRLDVELLIARVAAGHHVLAAILDPLHRPAGLHGHQRGQHGVLADQVNLLTEAAADVGHDDADVVDAERFGHRFVDDLRRLRVAPDRQPLRRVTRRGRRMARAASSCSGES